MPEYSTTDLNAEIQTVHESLSQIHNAAPKSWMVQAVMDRHTDVQGEDADFALYASQCHVTRTVEAYIRSIKRHEEEGTADRQLVIEGYERLQHEYVIQRDDEPVIVRLDAMTDQEVAEKAASLRAYAAGALAHARELEQYLESRAGLNTAQ